MSLSETYHKHLLLFESALALVIAAGLIFLFDLDTTSVESFILEKGSTIFPLLASVSFVLLGFVLTSITIILSLFRIPDSRLQLLKGRTQYIKIFNIYFFSLACLASTGIISSLSIILTLDVAKYLLYVLIWSTLVSGFALYRCVWALYHLVKISNIRTDEKQCINYDESEKEVYG